MVALSTTCIGMLMPYGSMNKAHEYLVSRG